MRFVAVTPSLLPQARTAYDRHDWRAAVALYRQSLEAGENLVGPDLERLGKAAWWIGDREGCLDAHERGAAAVGGELGPWATGIVLCNAISAYRDSADYAGAGEWAERAARWCERQSIHGFPGICRVRRAEVLRLRGAWVDAEREARAAGEALERFLVAYAAQAYLELGEIRLRLGDHPGAEAAFRQVHALGTDPQPGQGLLMLARGEPQAAARGLRRALENVNLVTVERARILEALVEAQSTFDQAGSATTASELEDIAASNPRPALRAMALRARGSIDVAAGKQATAALRQALQLWRSLDAPYEVARTRVPLAASYQLEGDAEGARQ